MTSIKLILVVFLLTATAESRNITIYNKCSFTIWPGILGPGNPSEGGFRLDTGDRKTIQVDDYWSAGRIWARTGCDEYFNCETGFCRNSEQCNGAEGFPPASLAEFSLKSYGGQDFYDVYLVNGYNLPIQINPIGGSGCNPAGGCVKDINTECPDFLSVKGRNGNTVACKSGCLGYNTDQECCRGDYGTPDKCQPSQTAQMFKDACPTAYSYAFDDNTSRFTCQSTASYIVKFC
uniref:Thaumatin-like protein n=1 Tax=Caenorhabditis tropicalis TaxID=1561998 RepID=A0A1I7TX80_9PELO